ncbi:pectate lyase-like adhesive domain-containing protein [Bacillus sp. AFS041924]|uniref:pectate lyase-like adhesive domain-containing protein n=1 Tax=Bacillus sp. AFS041924 TaxID=2033503 RepID=UPI000BFC2025|nr:pectate lyase-like adhesive domain-containing protein [Bacillus sp. AFS041924]PGS48631.1 hypothetical protein COC46_17100 [Bacillus sp. AFS041924]
MVRCLKKLILVISITVILSNQFSLITLAEDNGNDTPVITSNELTINDAQTPTDESSDQSTSSQSETRAFAVDVSSFAQFRDAIRNVNISEINIVKDITDAPEGHEILVPGHDIKIYGNNYKIDLNKSWIRLQNITNATQYKFSVEDATLINKTAFAFVQTHFNDYRSEYWSLSFKNITTNPEMVRLAAASRSNFTFDGTNKIYTRAENVYTGGMTFLPNSTYEGFISYFDYSIIWFQDRVSSTGITSHQFNVKENARVILRGTTNGATYPGIFQYYDSINIAPGGVLDVEKQGVSVAFHQDNSSLNIEKGATFKASTLSTGTNVIGIDARRVAKDILINVKEGSNFFVVGNSTSPIVNLATTGSKLLLSKPANYDIRNNNNLSSNNGYAVQLGTGATFEIVNSKVNTWTKGMDLDGTSAYSWDNASLITNSSGIPIYASNATIQSNYNGKTFSRISGTNMNPMIMLNELTNADMKISGKITVDGITAWDKQAVLKISNNEDDQTWNATTNQNGEFGINLEKFYKENTVFTAVLLKDDAPIEGTQTLVTVKDVTPPTPVTINEPVTVNSQKITGLSDEPGSKVTATLNGLVLVLFEEINVDQEGKWEIPLNSSLEEGDIIQVFLTDNNHNKNPESDTVYHDATFKEATKTKIVKQESPILKFDKIPKSINFKTTSISSSETYVLRNDTSLGLSVFDSRGTGSEWTIRASIDEPLTSTTNPDHKMIDALVFVDRLGNSTPLNNNELLIFQQTTQNDPITHVNWADDRGILVKTDFGDVYSESYSTTINWTLSDAP